MPWDPLSRVIGDLPATTVSVEIEASKRILFFFLREIEELRQVYNLQSIQVTEHKVLLNCNFPIAKTKGRGMQACIKYE